MVEENGGKFPPLLINPVKGIQKGEGKKNEEEKEKENRTEERKKEK